VKILMMSKTGRGFGIAHKLSEEGHDIQVFVQNRRCEDALLGVVGFVQGWRPVAAEWADLVIADEVGFGQYAAVLDGFGVPHIGINLIGDKLGSDPAKQIQAMRKVDIQIPETYEFDSPGEAREMLRELWGRDTIGWSIMPSGKVYTGKPFKVRDQDTLEWALEYYAADQAVIAQKLVYNSIEIGTTGWFSGELWVEPFSHNMDDRRLLNDDLGLKVDSMGSVSWAVSGKDMFVDELQKLAPILKAAQYKGPITLHSVASKKGIFAIDITAGFSYDGIEALYELLAEPLADVLIQIGLGTRSENKVRKGMYGVVARLTVLPYPHMPPDYLDKGMPILGVPSSVNSMAHCFLMDISKDGAIYRWAASSGVLMKISASDKNLSSAVKTLYKRIERITTPGVQYRTDIGSRVAEDTDELEQWEYLTPPSFLQSITSLVKSGAA